jgi:hypothetical protein
MISVMRVGRLPYAAGLTLPEGLSSGRADAAAQGRQPGPGGLPCRPSG